MVAEMQPASREPCPPEVVPSQGKTTFLSTYTRCCLAALGAESLGDKLGLGQSVLQKPDPLPPEESNHPAASQYPSTSPHSYYIGFSQYHGTVSQSSSSPTLPLQALGFSSLS